MSSSGVGGVYPGSGGQPLYGDGREVEPRPGLRSSTPAPNEADIRYRLEESEAARNDTLRALKMCHDNRVKAESASAAKIAELEAALEATEASHEDEEAAHQETLSMLFIAKARAEQAESRTANLLAMIFRDGGHRRDAIGDDKSVEEAHKVWAELIARAEQAESALRNEKHAYGEMMAARNLERHKVQELESALLSTRAEVASHIGDIIRRIGVAASRDWIRERLEELHNRLTYPTPKCDASTPATTQQQRPT